MLNYPVAERGTKNLPWDRVFDDEALARLEPVPPLVYLVPETAERMQGIRLKRYSPFLALLPSATVDVSLIQVFEADLDIFTLQH